MDGNKDCTDEKPHSMETNTSSSNMTADELGPEIANKLRGDAIGDTMYSEVFVLNTLLQLSDLKWSKEVEDNFCFLWDMTEEADVCQFLFKLSYPSLACSAIEKYTEGRFIEIVVGIFANLLCSQCEKNITEDEIKTVLNLLNSDDPYVLTQVMRFIQAISFIFDKLYFIQEEHLDKIHFILYNSTNKELLTTSLKALQAITDDTKLKENVIKGEWLLSAVTAYRTLNDDCDENCEVFESQAQHTNIRHVIQILCNICSYIDCFGVNRLVVEVRKNLNEFTNEIVILLNYYSKEESLLPIDEVFRFYLEGLTYVCRVLNVGYISSVAQTLYKIVYLVFKKDSANLDVVCELFCYFISAGSLGVFRTDFENVPPAEIKDVLSYIEKNNFSFEFDYVVNLRNILSEL